MCPVLPRTRRHRGSQHLVTTAGHVQADRGLGSLWLTWNFPHMAVQATLLPSKEAEDTLLTTSQTLALMAGTGPLGEHWRPGTGKCLVALYSACGPNYLQEWVW